MICFLYDLVFFLFAFVAIPHFLLRLRQADDPLRLIKERWGVLSKDFREKLDGREIVWVHAVSVGEVLGLKRFLEKACAVFPQFQFVLSVTTPTGYKIARQKLENIPVFYTPFDVSWVTRRVLKTLRPRALLLMETEIWPNLITSAGREGVRIGLLNGRLSPNSFKGYFLVRQFLRPLLKQFAFFAVQTETDRERFELIGAATDRVHITGSLKFDEVSEVISVDIEKLRKTLSITVATPVFLAGSTHPGEEEFILDVFTELRKKHPRLFLILAPRHVERAEQIVRAVKQAGFEANRFSGAPGAQSKRDVLVIDVMGKLQELYAVSDIVFIGGSLIKHGGQNPVEAVRFSRGVISGPFVFNFQKIFDILREEGAAEVVHSREDLVRVADGLLSNPSKRKEAGEKAHRLVLKLRGATEKHLELLRIHLAGTTRICHDALLAREPIPVLIRKFYLRTLDGEENGLLAQALRLVLELLSVFYATAVSLIQEFYAQNAFRRKKLPIPVVSVGNLTWGGTGKTPLVDYITGYLESKGKKVFILTRGYGSDETRELERAHPSARVVVGRDRYASAIHALAENSADVAVLDDGFQHWRLWRNLDIVSINCLSPFGNEKVIPAGILREPIAAVRRADFILLTHTNLAESEKLVEIKNHLKLYGIEGNRIVETVHEPQYFYRASSGNRISVEELSSKQALVFSGIGHPAAFERTLANAGVRVARAVRFTDHHMYSAEELRGIKAGAAEGREAITTEKDFLRSPELMIDTVDPLVLKIRIRITKGEEIFRARLDSLFHR